MAQVANVTGRLSHIFLRRKRALRFGIVFFRTADFKLPNSILLNGKRTAVCIPDEPGVRWAFDEVLFGDCYGLEKLKSPIRTVLDVGANVGIFALAVRHYFPEAQIHCYEPNPLLERYLQVQATAAQAVYFMEATQAENGRVSLDVNPDSVHTRSRLDITGTIAATSFAAAVERLGGSVDLVKLDCEGAEWDIWHDHAAWQSVRNLTVEYHLLGGQTHTDAANTVGELGFTVEEQHTAGSAGLLRAVRVSKIK